MKMIFKGYMGLKITEMNLTEIEEYLMSITDEDTNLYMRCLECDEYVPICNMNADTEECNHCNEEKEG